MSDAPLLVTRAHGVVRATMNNPARRNALSGGMLEAWDSLIAALATDRTARVLVIAGADGHFCAGLDLTAVADGGADAAEQRNRAMGARFAALAALPQAVVACVQGSAFAGGLGFVCAADIALSDATARFSAPEVRRGLVPAQILPWLVRRMGPSSARHLVLEGAVLDAAGALHAGLVHQVLPDAPALAARRDALTADLLRGGTLALAETKALLAALSPPPDAAYAALAAAAFSRTATSAEAAEGVAAFMEKRQPNWA